MTAYLADIRRFPATLNPRLIDCAAMNLPACGRPRADAARLLPASVRPRLALVGDAGHFKHLVTAQGIADAVEQARFLADALLGAALPSTATRYGATPGPPSTTSGPSSRLTSRVLSTPTPCSPGWLPIGRPGSSGLICSPACGGRRRSLPPSG
jgi:hypothetical protein